VAREVFNRCIMGVLREKTRILVTNQLQFVSAADTAIFMAAGRVAEIGTYSQLMSRGDSFAQLMSQAEVRGDVRSQKVEPYPLKEEWHDVITECAVFMAWPAWHRCANSPYGLETNRLHVGLVQFCLGRHVIGSLPS
jgi:hypothetical protein